MHAFFALYMVFCKIWGFLSPFYFSFIFTLIFSHTYIFKERFLIIFSGVKLDFLPFLSVVKNF